MGLEVQCDVCEGSFTASYMLGPRSQLFPSTSHEVLLGGQEVTGKIEPITDGQ